MGMVACFAALPRVALEHLQSEPGEIEDYLYPDDGDSEPPHSIDIDKSWHGLHYLLTGQAEGGPEPFSLAVQGGQEFGPEVGYGPARYLTPEQVQHVAAALGRTSAQSLVDRFDPQDMEAKAIYPEVIWVRDNEDALDYVLDGYQQLQVFYRDAAARGDAVIQWLS
jgi:hypothetical protein